MKPLVLVNVVGLTPELATRAPVASSIGTAVPLSGPVPAVTCTAQATMLTGVGPATHGIVGNGWMYRDTSEIRFWQQAHSLLQAPSVTSEIETYSVGWWFPMGAPLAGYVTPRPHYGADGSKVLAVLDRTGCDLERHLGPFPFPAFWGPMAGIGSSRWLSEAAARVLRDKTPPLTLVYLPHLDYDYQRNTPGSQGPLDEVDACLATILKAAADTGAEVAVISEYGLVPVNRAVHLNRELRRLNWLDVRDGPFGEQLNIPECRAVACCDHQLAHIYVNGLDPKEVRRELEAHSGIQAVGPAAEFGLAHERSGDLVALAQPDAWFAYPFWNDDSRAPDYARCVDIHRKPGYDPCELFMTSKLRAGLQLLKKKAGFRYLMDVVPLDTSLVKGSHGRRNTPDQGAVMIARDPVGNMTDIAGWLKGRLKP